MTSAPNNETFTRLFMQAKADENLPLLKELQEIGKLAMGWNRCAIVYENSVNCVSKTSIVLTSIVEASVCRVKDSLIMEVVYTSGNAGRFARERCYYGMTMNENDALTGKPFSKEGWEAYIALFEEWLNSGLIAKARG